MNHLDINQSTLDGCSSRPEAVNTRLYTMLECLGCSLIFVLRVGACETFNRRQKAICHSLRQLKERAVPRRNLYVSLL